MHTVNSYFPGKWNAKQNYPKTWRQKYELDWNCELLSLCGAVWIFLSVFHINFLSDFLFSGMPISLISLFLYPPLTL